MNAPPLLFGLHASHHLALAVSRAVGWPLAAHEEREFEDGEHKARALETVRDRDVYVIQSLHAERTCSVNDKLMRLLLFCAALRQSGAGRVTAVAPYLCYSRKDRRTKPNDPVSSRYVAALFEAMGVDRMVTVDVHNLSAFQNAFRCPTEQLEARHLFADVVAGLIGEAPVLVLSPDAGGMKRAERFRESLARRLGRGVDSGIMEKRRQGGVVSGELLLGDVRGRRVLVFDDLIASGATLVRAARAAKQAGAGEVIGIATHALFTAAARRTLADAALARIVVSDTAPLPAAAGALAGKLTVVPVAPLLAGALRALHDGRSLDDLSEVYGY